MRYPLKLRPGVHFRDVDVAVPDDRGLGQRQGRRRRRRGLLGGIRGSRVARFKKVPHAHEGSLIEGGRQRVATEGAAPAEAVAHRLESDWSAVGIEPWVVGEERLQRAEVCFD